MSSFWSYLSVSVLMLVGLLLIFIILLQRGRGGGLAGAFGGAGGQSALGTKAGDVFTKITVGLAVIWVFLACMSIYALRYDTNSRISGLPDAVEDSAPEPEEAGPDKTEGGSGGAGSGTPTTPAEAEGGTNGTPGAAQTLPPADQDAAGDAAQPADDTPTGEAAR